MYDFNAREIQNMLLEDKIKMVESLLISTGREGSDKMLSYLRNTDFYSAPASSKFHSNYKHGLLDHSLIVYTLCKKYRDVVAAEKPEIVIPDDKIIVISLLHDICKTCLYYDVIKNKKDINGNWYSYSGYELNDTFPIGHGEKSVIMIQNIGFKLEPDEMLAIRYHMGFYDDDNSIKQAKLTATKMTPLVPILQMADYTASTIIEPTIEK